MKRLTNSENQTFNLAKKLARQLKGGEIIGLVGELGAGKTIFVKGLAAGLGIKKNITSPTFVLMKIYKIPKIKTLNLKSPLRRSFSEASKILNLIHIDAYRLKLYKELKAIGAEEYFRRSDTITVIEWADRVKKILTKKTKFVNIINKGGNKRLIKY